MKYKYRAFGIPIYSEIELPALVPYNGSEEGIKVYARSVPVELSDPAASENPFTKYNSRELMYDLPEIGRYYVLDGAEIWVEPLSDDIKTVLLYFYSNCLAAVLLQRNLLVYHVSGVLDSQGKVVLIAGHSGAGKSTTATFLRSLGFTLFTDDTAILRVMDGKCYAKASYPMARLWEQTIAVQDVYTGDSKEVLRSKAEQYKYGFYFHDSFIEEEVEVSKILFLQEEGSEIVARDLSLTEGLTSLSANLYRAHWHKGMKKQKLVFQQLSQIINTVPVHQICRPKGKATFETFAQSIATNYL